MSHRMPPNDHYDWLKFCILVLFVCVVFLAGWYVVWELVS